MAASFWFQRKGASCLWFMVCFSGELVFHYPLSKQSPGLDTPAARGEILSHRRVCCGPLNRQFPRLGRFAGRWKTFDCLSMVGHLPVYPQNPLRNFHMHSLVWWGRPDSNVPTCCCFLSADCLFTWETSLGQSLPASPCKSVCGIILAPGYLILLTDGVTLSAFHLFLGCTLPFLSFYTLSFTTGTM